ncbi:hypothetical protein CLAIMM_07578 [Cladophialophora immunda]|nr:hypothetical protein CLAIMM_07578 [Cladophialophora immunda]
MDDRISQPSDSQAPPPIRRHKIRRTFGSVRKGIPPRHFTDPIVRLNKDEAYGSIVPSAAFSNLSPMSNVSTFEVDLPHGTPVFNSSPPSYGPPQNRFTIAKRISVAPSDPTTASSDNDTRVFTDDDSMDFQSDTAYDSLATRATASSHSGFRQPKIETIFDEISVDQPAETSAIEELMQRATLDDAQSIQRDAGHGQSSNIGIGISGLEAQGEMQNFSPDQASTPVKSPTAEVDDFVLTPVPKRKYREAVVLGSSPPSAQLFPRPRDVEPELPPMMDIDDEDDIDWSPKSASDRNQTATKELPSSPIQSRFEQPSEDDFDEQHSTKRSSIFDWSEHPKFGSDQSNGINPRPQTVHGKQGSHVGRSRASGRKNNAAMHLRSQSVPVVNRDSVSETDTPSSATKFGTWALGSKPVSEEWSDDFEFDDADVGEEAPGTAADESKAMNRESIRSVKVPQSIIDRQQSVHVQFGQVRDFMLLVEELKRLRLRGATLGLLESHSRQLWEDAGSIIDLATVNEDDEALPRVPSPVSSDIFGDETPPPKRTVDDEDGRLTSRRSISSPATPPYGRPRGESVQAKNFLQAIHQNRREAEASLAEESIRGRGRDRDKLPFDTQDLRDLVVRAGVITRALKEIVRKAEGVSLSPERPAQKFQEPVFRQIFDPPNSSPSPESRKPGLPKSRSANSYLDTVDASADREISQPLNFTKVVEAN